MGNRLKVVSETDKLLHFQCIDDSICEGLESIYLKHLTLGLGSDWPEGINSLGGMSLLGWFGRSGERKLHRGLITLYALEVIPLLCSSVAFKEKPGEVGLYIEDALNTNDPPIYLTWR